MIGPSKSWRPRAASPDRPDLDAVARTLKTRDYEMLGSLLRGGFMTLDQLALLHCPNPKGTASAGIFMKRFWQQGLVESFRPSREGIGIQGGSARLVYCLARPGATLAAAYLGRSLNDVWRARDQFVQLSHVYHRLAIVDFWAALTVWARQTGGQVLEVEIEPRYKEGKLTLAADALMTYQQPDQMPQTLWIEMDRGTESVPRFLERMATYDAYFRATRGRYGDNPPGVLVLVAAGRNRPGDSHQSPQQRLQALRGAMDRAVERWEFRRFKLAVTADLYDMVPSQMGALPPVRVDFNAPVCWICGRDERRPVF